METEWDRKALLVSQADEPRGGERNEASPAKHAQEPWRSPDWHPPHTGRRGLADQSPAPDGQKAVGTIEDQAPDQVLRHQTGREVRVWLQTFFKVLWPKCLMGYGFHTFIVTCHCTRAVKVQDPEGAIGNYRPITSAKWRWV